MLLLLLLLLLMSLELLVTRSRLGFTVAILLVVVVLVLRIVADFLLDWGWSIEGVVVLILIPWLYLPVLGLVSRSNLILIRSVVGSSRL